MTTRAASILGLCLLLCGACDQSAASTPPSTSAQPSASAPRVPTAGPTAVGGVPGADDGIPAPPDVAAPPADAEKTASGLASKILVKGTGDTKPTVTDKVKVHYTGWTKDGKMFDSSRQTGNPAEFQVSGVIKGWTEALQLMVVGEQRRLWIPAKLAYGDSPRMGAPAGDLTFDVELLSIEKGPEPPQVPADLTKPPKDAKKTKSGLVWKILSKGKEGGKKPSATDRVQVHYSGWTKDGTMFDSSVTRGRPASFKLDGVIKGWTEGLQLISEGDKVRLWIPADLAYGDKPQKPGAPAGDLVFDVELLGIR
jgi:FKBP-type peptidyl-prolyl cis-trans isomerase